MKTTTVVEGINDNVTSGVLPGLEIDWLAAWGTLDKGPEMSPDTNEVDEDAVLETTTKSEVEGLVDGDELKIPLDPRVREVVLAVVVGADKDAELGRSLELDKERLGDGEILDGTKVERIEVDSAVLVRREEDRSLVLLPGAFEIVLPTELVAATLRMVEDDG